MTQYIWCVELGTAGACLAYYWTHFPLSITHGFNILSFLNITVLPSLMIPSPPLSTFEAGGVVRSERSSASLGTWSSTAVAILFDITQSGMPHVEYK